MKIYQNIVSLASNVNGENYDSILQPGAVLGNNFKVLGLLRIGYNLVSYLCEELNTGENVVVYVLPWFDELQAQMERWLNALASVESKYIFTKYQVETLSTQELFIVAKYPEGKSIRQWCNENDIANEENRLLLKHLLLEAAIGLDHLHSRGMLHGYVIPDNLFVTKDHSLLLLNTGIISLAKPQFGKHQTKFDDKEHLGYQAPELLNGCEANSASEQYALAAITYELFSGTKPFDWVTRADMLRKVVSKQMPDPPKNATKLESSAILRALSCNPQKRFSSCKRFANSLIPFHQHPVKIKICGGIALAFLVAVFCLSIHSVVGQINEKTRIRHLEAEAKAEKQRLETEMEIQSNEAGQLQWKANVALQEIYARKLDEGQKFGERIKIAQEKYSLGEKAMNDGQRVVAYTLFREAIENSDWIRNNVEFRNSLKKRKQRLLALLADNGEDAKTLFPARWQNTTDLYYTAVVSYENGDFSQAEKQFNEVEAELSCLGEETRSFMIQQYVEAAGNAMLNGNWDLASNYATRIASLDSELGKEYIEKAASGKKLVTISSELALAQNAKELTKWEDVIKHCMVILELDNDNETARKLREEASLATTCNLQAQTVIANENIECSVEINNKMISGTTRELIKNLPYNTAISVRFVGIKDNMQYEWNGTIDCNWKGVQTTKFTLEKSYNLLLDKAQKALEEKKWEDLLTFCDQLLTLEPTADSILQMKEIAENELSCNIDIIPIINGSVAKAYYFLNSQEHCTGQTLQKLEFNQEYTINLLAEENGIQYEGRCQFTADWRGVKQITVKMLKTSDVLLQRAQVALDNKEWQKAYDNANAVLSLIPEDISATKLHDAAELWLTSNLKIRALLNGYEVEATITISPRSEILTTTAQIIRGLEAEKEFHYFLSYSFGGRTYTGQCDGICDWIGIKEMVVVLEDEFQRLSLYASQLAQKGNWEELSSVARDMLDLEATNESALRYFELAETNLTANLKIQPSLNSLPVVCDIYQCDFIYKDIRIRELGKTSSILKNSSITPGKKYYVTYTDGNGFVYWGQFTIEKGWNGLKTVNVALKGLDLENLSLGNEIILQMEPRRSAKGNYIWRSKNEITEKQYKVVTDKSDLFTILEVRSSFSFAGEPIFKKVKKVNWEGLDNFCKYLTVKCINEGIIPPGLEFSTLNQGLPEKSKSLRIYLVKSKSF